MEKDRSQLFSHVSTAYRLWERCRLKRIQRSLRSQACGYGEQSQHAGTDRAFPNLQNPRKRDLHHTPNTSGKMRVGRKDWGAPRPEDFSPTNARDRIGKGMRSGSSKSLAKKKSSQEPEAIAKGSWLVFKKLLPWAGKAKPAQESSPSRGIPVRP